MLFGMASQKLSAIEYTRLTSCVAFRAKMRNEIIPLPSQESSAFEEKVKLAREIATVLRTNFVQGAKVGDSAEDGVAKWSA